METINWIDRIEAELHCLFNHGNCVLDLHEYNDLLNLFCSLAKEVHDKACEEQKQICAEEAKIYWESHVDRDSIINSPNANFNIE